MDGVEVCREIRKTSRVPIIMLTARVEEFDEIIGLEIGADDYIKKPFSPNILVARVNSILRRFKDESEIQVGEIIINPERMEVKKRDQLLTLTTTQFNILFLLASHPGRVYTREQILEHLYLDLDSRYTMERTIDAHVKSIRKLLEDDPKTPKYVITMIGKGYKFSGD
jgi:DNA-binding response OmpR family regulator